MAFNPGTYQLKLGLEKLRSVFAATTVLFLNKEEAERVLEKKAEIPQLLRDLYKEGPKIVVVTDGQKGSYCFDGKHSYSLGILDFPVVERTGAGDSYATAFVAALAHGEDVATAMRWGSANAGSVVQYVGAQAGLLTKAKILSLLKKYPEFRVRIT
jgi:sugar/nucleoside kinase (ribokinase family)